MFSKKKTECRVCGYRFTDDDGNAADPATFPSMVVIYNGERVKE